MRDKMRAMAEEQQELRRAAAQGDADAQYKLGIAYYHGEGVPEDEVEAVKWYRKAAEQGHAEAQYRLGLAYVDGEGVPWDNVAGFEWLRKAAVQGQAEAQFVMGNAYYLGEGMPQDSREGVKWLRKAAVQGQADSQFFLGSAYYAGEGVSPDQAKGIKWLRKAAVQGLAAAQSLLGLAYHLGIGAPQDDAEAVKWYRKAAKQGYAEAQARLGDCYDEGNGVSQDHAKAVKWYRKAAVQGDENARMWLRKTAEQGDLDAQLALNEVYYRCTGAPEEAMVAQCCPICGTDVFESASAACEHFLTFMDHENNEYNTSAPIYFDNGRLDREMEELHQLTLRFAVRWLEGDQRHRDEAERKVARLDPTLRTFFRAAVKKLEAHRREWGSGDASKGTVEEDIEGDMEGDIECYVLRSQEMLQNLFRQYWKDQPSAVKVTYWEISDQPGLSWTGELFWATNAQACADGIRRTIDQHTAVLREAFGAF